MKAVARFKKLIREGSEQVNLARTYLEDGAILTAAEQLHQAADKLHTAALIEYRALKRAGAKTVNLPIEQLLFDEQPTRSKGPRLVK